MGKIRGVCEVDGCNNLQRHQYKTKDGVQGWGKLCDTHHRQKYNMRYGDSKRGRKPIIGIPKIKCSRCGFVPEHVSQLDYHHIDENKKNNEKTNIKVLCANCHRLVHLK